MAEPASAGEGQLPGEARSRIEGRSPVGGRSPAEKRFVVEARLSPGPVEHPVDRPGLAGFLERVAEDISPGDRRGASLRVVTDREICGLNSRYRGKNAATDVLAFPADGSAEDPWPDGEPRYLGDLVISKETALRQAFEAGHPLDCELRLLALHGLLHLFGYDHEVDRGEMTRLERLLRLRHGLPASQETLPEAP